LIETVPIALSVILAFLVAGSFLLVRVPPLRGRTRALAVAPIPLLLLAAVGVSLPARPDSRDVLVIDVSRSVGAPPPDAGALATKAGLDPARTRVVLFGARAVVLPESGGAWPAIAAAEVRRAGREASDLGAGLRTAASLVDPGGTVVIATDGRVDAARAAEAGVAVRARGALVCVLGRGARIEGDRRVEGLRLPSRVTADTRVAAAVVVAGPPGESVGLVVRIDGADTWATTIVLPRSGRATARVDLPPLTGGFHEVSAAISGEGEDLLPENDRVAAGIVAAGERRAVTVNADGLVAMLERSGFRVESARSAAEARLASADLLVLRNVPAPEMREGGGRVADFVAGGGGLLLLGGRRAFGAGAYGGRPIESCLPLTSDPGERGMIVVLLLDRSGTMARPFDPGGESKLATACAAAGKLVAALSPGTRLLVVSFAGEADAAEPIRLDGVEARTRAAALLDAIPRAGGPTALVPPLRRALAAVSGAEAERALVLLLSDGRLEGEDPAEVVAAAEALRRGGARLSALAVGEDAALDLLARVTGDPGEVVAVGGGGEIEEAFLSALLRAEGEGRILDGVRAVRRGPGLSSPYGFDLPPVFGMVRTWARADAEVWTVAEGGLPLVAGWRHGLGTAVAVATDPLGAWASAWAETGLLSALASGAAGPVDLGGTRAGTEVAYGFLGITLFAPDAPARLEGRLVPVEGAPVPISFRAEGEGRLSARLPAPPPGAARLSLPGLDGGVSIPWPEEYRASGPDERRLALLAEALGGDPAPARARRDVRHLPALLALLLFLLDRAILPRSSLKRRRAEFR